MSQCAVRMYVIALFRRPFCAHNWRVQVTHKWILVLYIQVDVQIWYVDVMEIERQCHNISGLSIREKSGMFRPSFQYHGINMLSLYIRVSVNGNWSVILHTVVVAPCPRHTIDSSRCLTRSVLYLASAEVSRPYPTTNMTEICLPLATKMIWSAHSGQVT